ncbi:MAG: copper-translocating P-type ATPase [Bacteroides sp.]|nr:copper-translocating P-type ATPase [Bacteroides sp.]
MAEKQLIQDNFPVVGMSCAACSARVEKTLNKQPGVCSATVNLATATATVHYDPALTSPQTLQQAVQTIGFDLIIRKEEQVLQQVEEDREQSYRSLKRRTIGAIILSLPVMVIGMFFMDMPYASFVMCLLTTPVVFGLGRHFFINAWRLLKHGSANMDTLVANSTGIAYLFSLFNMLFPEVWTSRGIEPHVYFEASSVIIAFILLGRLLEAKAKSNTSTAIKRLMGLRPRTVIRLNAAGLEEEIPIAEIHQGDLILVKPGERIAVDGVVTEGSSYVDESMLSGEPVPVSKEKGAQVFAGTINQKGCFRFKAEKVGTDTLLAKIIHLVQEAQGSKAPVQQLVDKIAAIFVPVIMGIALLTFCVWWMAGGDSGFTHGLLAAVTVLIIACPCALGLATPTAIMVGMGKGAEWGILIKDAVSLETARKVHAVVVDKTGTLTEGTPRVVDVAWSAPSDELRNILYSIERMSEHPLAEAVTHSLQACEVLSVRDFESLTGRGVKGVCNHETYYVGNRCLLEEQQINIPPALLQEVEPWEAEARSVIWLADSRTALAALAITDRLKQTSVGAVEKLHSLGIEVHMLTGDQESVACEVARQAGISHYRAGVLPQDKADYVKSLQRQGYCVAMVGDGINDSAALAQADLSIAMGSGSDIAMDVAQMTIISSDLRKIAEAIRLSRLTVRTIRQNLFWAFIYNIIGVPIAAGILYPLNGFLLNPMIAGAAMAFSSVSVVTNSLHLKRLIH